MSHCSLLSPTRHASKEKNQLSQCGKIYCMLAPFVTWKKAPQKQYGEYNDADAASALLSLHIGMEHL